MINPKYRSSNLKLNNSRTALLLLISFLFLLIFSSAHATPTNPNSNELQSILLKQGYIEIPLQMADTQNTLLVQVSFDGKENYPFIVDTGSVRTYIDEKLVKKYNFQQGVESIMTTGGDGNRRQSDSYSIPNFQINSLISHHVITYAQDHSFIRIYHDNIMGILGLDFLRSHAAVLDIVNKRLYLKSDNTPLSVASLDQLKNLGYQSFKLELTPSGHATILVQINNETPKAFLVDTGIPITLLAESYVKDLGLKQLSKIIKESGSGGGEIELYKTHINNLTLGSIHWYPYEVGVIDFKYMEVGIPLYGVLGFDWIKTNKAIIDISNNLLLAK